MTFWNRPCFFSFFFLFSRRGEPPFNLCRIIRNKTHTQEEKQKGPLRREKRALKEREREKKKKRLESHYNTQRQQTGSRWYIVVVWVFLYIKTHIHLCISLYSLIDRCHTLPFLCRRSSKVLRRGPLLSLSQHQQWRTVADNYLSLSLLIVCVRYIRLF